MNRGTLINFFDMIIKLGGHEVAYAYGYLANAQGLSTNEPITRALDPDGKVHLLDALDQVRDACQNDRLNLPFTLAHIPRVRKIVESSETYEDVQQPIAELRMRMHDELAGRLFLFIPPIEAAYYAIKQAFGTDVEKRFGSLGGDIEEAGDCIALGKPTAAVFHLMRVMESLVQVLGDHFGLAHVENQNWQVILDQINKQLKSLPDGTEPERGHKEAISAAAANLFNVKIAWRNPTMHPKATYTVEEAVGIYDCVKRFAAHLATVI